MRSLRSLAANKVDRSLRAIWTIAVQYSGPISSVAFSPDGQRIVTGSRDQTAKVWEAATKEQVDAWPKEEKAAAERLTAQRTKRGTAK